MGRFAKMVAKPIALASLLCLKVSCAAHVAPYPIKAIPLHLSHSASTSKSGLYSTSLSGAHSNLLATSLNRLPGYSGAASTLIVSTKTITASGISGGAFQSLQGQVASGQFSGTLYENFGSFSYTIGPFAFATGNSPYNTLAPYGSPVPAGLTSNNVISFLPGTTPGARTTTFSISPRPIKAAAGGEKFLNNYFKEVAGKSTSLGQSIGASGIIAGRFSGATYGTSPTVIAPNYLSNSYAVYAFGKDPYNTGLHGQIDGPWSVPAANYIQFGNGRVINYYSGFLQGNSYLPFQGITNGPLIFAIGSNPYAIFPGNGIPFTFANPHSYLFGR